VRWLSRDIFADIDKLRVGDYGRVTAFVVAPIFVMYITTVGIYIGFL
jgi:hypothetical protein